jgi:prephenate dehydratase
MKTAFQGATGAFSEEAVEHLVPDGEPVPLPTFEETFEALVEGQVDRAVLPIENSLFGSVHANYDLLREHDVRITGEVQLRIRHHLMAPAGTTHESIRRVYSHPQALGQCRDFLRSELPAAEAIAAYDTAGAARMVAAMGLTDTAAIASSRAAEAYGLEVLRSGVESHHRNYTRFLLLARPEDVPDSLPAGPAVKTSIVYTLGENVPGALFKSLAAFALRDIDLFKLESRPLPGSPGQYLFYLDLRGGAAEEPIARALDHLAELTSLLKILGSYSEGAMVGE